MSRKTCGSLSEDSVSNRTGLTASPSTRDSSEKDSKSHYVTEAYNA